jgi:hypothetical protein
MRSIKFFTDPKIQLKSPADFNRLYYSTSQNAMAHRNSTKIGENLYKWLFNYGMGLIISQAVR